MLDIKKLREDSQALKQSLINRNAEIDVDELLCWDEEKRKLLTRVEELKSQRNSISKEVGQIKRNGGDAQDLMEKVRNIGEDISTLDKDILELEQKINDRLLIIPNICSEKTPIGKDENDNVEQRKFGEPRQFEFEAKAHWDIGTKLNILDFDAASKISGARFTVYKGLGARLERAVINFFLNQHVDNGYVEIYPPYMVTRETMTGTGQLPKFEDDAYKVDQNTFLIPTAEVPVTNLYKDSILKAEELPIRHCAYSTCFRAEAGSAGRDTRGLIRQHQFNKVELVKITKPEESYYELEHMTNSAEKMLELLKLPYRVIALCSGDIGFSAAKTYDIEVWMPSYNKYLEISSCSNCEDFQARRANIRFKRGPKDKPEYAHTLNGSGLAVGRTVAAILENYQNEDGSVTVPEVLVPYMGCEIIK